MLDLYYGDTDACISYSHRRTSNPPEVDFHLHNRFEIYFFISGGVNYFIEKKVYPLKYGDLLLINSHEIHRPTFVSAAPYERITIHFEPAVAQAFNSPRFDLLRCFTGRPDGEANRISLAPDQVGEVMKLFARMEGAVQEGEGGGEILKLSLFVELLVFINNAGTCPDNALTVPEKLSPVLDYIETNLAGDLCLEALERRLFINRYYLSRLFKQYTGSTIHEYIIYKRISLAKKLLDEGHNVTEACQRSGFRDYSNFIRIFKKTVGISPGRYKSPW
jgi:AraC-like DNA-binding protein